jgi:hypothetical protein
VTGYYQDLVRVSLARKLGMPSIIQTLSFSTGPTPAYLTFRMVSRDIVFLLLSGESDN